MILTSNLFSELAKYSKKVRKNEYAQTVLDRPISLLEDKVYSNGNWEKRTRVVLMARPCKVGTCSMCPFPDEGLVAPHLDENIIKQLKNSLDYSGKSSILTIYHNGNFFLDTEISPNLRDKIYEEIKKAKYKALCVESLPQTISKKKIETFERALPGVRLEVCIGVQSCDPFVRKYCTLSPFSAGQLENAFESLLSRGHAPRCFLMFGQPFLNY